MLLGKSPFFPEIGEEGKARGPVHKSVIHQIFHTICLSGISGIIRPFILNFPT